MNKTYKQLYVKNRNDWRMWLKKNHERSNEIWLIYYKKHTKKPRISYEDAIEEAICFGWIDSTVKRIDEEKFMQKFTPRTSRSQWSEINKKRALKMIKSGKMTEAGRCKIDAAKKNGEWNRRRAVAETNEPPNDFYDALKKNKNAKINFDKFSSSIKKQYFGWIISAKRDETRKRRIQKAVKTAEQNIKTLM